jgi:hypothetical protein
MIKLDKDYRYIARCKGRVIVPDGRQIGYRWRPSEKHGEQQIYIDGDLKLTYRTGIFNTAIVRVYDERGNLLRQLKVPANEPSVAERVVPVGAGTLRADVRGHFYLVRSALSIYNITVAGGLRVRRYAVLEYDEMGDFVGVRCIIGATSAVPSFNWIEVDSLGNVYWLDFKADHLDVMMAPVPKE